MIWIIIEMLFPALLVILPMSLYMSNRLFMAKFNFRMAGSESARKLYVQCTLIFLLLYHYVYAGGHFGEWGILISTIPCAVLFSFRRADRWMHRLHEDKKGFVMAALLTLAICAVPHLHTMAYPSCRVLAEWQDKDTREHLKENPKTMSEHYY
ncbi:MAG TPA: hypothetical protein DDX33_05025 [Rikenellaceae bacterium]|nr:hypothetical protein [Rikenellaceae bacterium]